LAGVHGRKKKCEQEIPETPARVAVFMRIHLLSSSKPAQCLARATLRDRFAILYRSGFIKTEGFGSALSNTISPFQCFSEE
jgi:hypothetical protein